MTPNVQNRRALLWIALSQILLALCFPPLPLGLFAFVALVPGWLATRGLTPGSAFRYHFIGGIGYNLVLYWWIYNVMKVGPSAVILIGLVLLILFLSLFNGLMGWLFRRCIDLPLGSLWFALGWVGIEVLRTKGQLAFPWSHLGYTLGPHTELIQGAAWFGVFGLGLCVLAVNLLVYHGIVEIRGRRYRLSGALALVGILYIVGVLSLRSEDPAPHAVADISLVQPSVLQTKKWDEGYFQEVMQQTWKAMERERGEGSAVMGSDLVVLPETAIPDFLKRRKEIIRELFGRAMENETDILVGALDYLPDPTGIKDFVFYNSAFLFTRDTGLTLRQYSKLRLVPFAEKLPFDDIFPIINYVDLGEGDFSSGPGYEIWGGDTLAYSPSICYEILFPDFVRQAKRMGARFLVNITNDGWFGRSGAPYQHANISRLRAVETGLPIARCANTGISVFYDHKGRILGKTALYEQTVLRRQLPLVPRETFYTTWGGWMENAWAISGIIVLVAVVTGAKKRSKSQPGGKARSRTAEP